MTADTDETDHFDMKADPPRVADIGQIRGAASYHLGNRIYIQTVEQLPDGDYMAYLGISLPYDTSAAAQQNEMSFINYGPIGGVRARAQQGGEWFELDLPDPDALERAFAARREYESEHRAALIPGLTNTLEDEQQTHFDHYSAYEPDDDHDSLSDLDLDEQELYDYAFHRGMARMAEIINQRVSRHLDGPYAGDRRWTKHDTRGVLGQR